MIGPGPTAPGRRRRRDPSFWVLTLLGVVLVVMPFVSPLRDFVEARFGEVHVVEILLGFVLIYLALLIQDVVGLREKNLVVMETLLAAFRGGGIAPKQREAVDILIAALRGPSEQAREAALRQLHRLTGQDLGTDPKAWEDWWASHRESFQGTPLKVEGTGKDHRNQTDLRH